MVNVKYDSKTSVILDLPNKPLTKKASFKMNSKQHVIGFYVSQIKVQAKRYELRNMDDMNHLSDVVIDTINDKLPKMAELYEADMKDTIQQIFAHNMLNRGKTNNTVVFFPYVGFEDLEFLIVNKLVNWKKNTIRTSKPTNKNLKYPSHRMFSDWKMYKDTDREEDFVHYCACYVWRMVMFYCSNRPTHGCLPVCADFDVPGKQSENKELRLRLDALVDILVDCAGYAKNSGANRWASALTGNSFD